MGRPTEAIPFTAMTHANTLGTKGTLGIVVVGGHAGMTAQIPNVHFWIGTTGGHNKVILGHVPSSVKLSLVLDLHADFNLSNSSTRRSKASELPLLIVIIGRCQDGSPRHLHLTIPRSTTTALLILVGVFFRIRRSGCGALVKDGIVLGKVDAGHHEVILFARGVRAQQ
eukprot:scaffold61816_cov54-Attheya_sp.AAC.2